MAVDIGQVIFSLTTAVNLRMGVSLELNQAKETRNCNNMIPGGVSYVTYSSEHVAVH